MAIIPECSVPATSFALPEALDQFPEVTVEADRIAAHAPVTVILEAAPGPERGDCGSGP